MAARMVIGPRNRHPMSMSGPWNHHAIPTKSPYDPKAVFRKNNRLGQNSMIFRTGMDKVVFAASIGAAKIDRAAPAPHRPFSLRHRAFAVFH
jgi:hypothetical protein